MTRHSPTPPASTPATRALIAAGVPFRLHHLEVTSEHYGRDAATHLHAQLGIEADRVFKTLLVDQTAGKGLRPQLAVGIVPVTGSVDLKALAAAIGVAKVSLADRADAERISGYIRGGISPLGMKKALPTVLDATAELAETIFVSGGRRGLDVELRPADLLTLTAGRLADIAHP